MKAKIIKTTKQDTANTLKNNNLKSEKLN